MKLHPSAEEAEDIVLKELACRAAQSDSECSNDAVFLGQLEWPELCQCCRRGRRVIQCDSSDGRRIAVDRSLGRQ